MSTLASQGLIEVSRTGITLLNREALEVAAGHLLRKRTKELQDASRAKERRSGPVRVVPSIP